MDHHPPPRQEPLQQEDGQQHSEAGSCSPPSTTDHHPPQQEPLQQLPDEKCHFETTSSARTQYLRKHPDALQLMIIEAMKDLPNTSNPEIRLPRQLIVRRIVDKYGVYALGILDIIQPAFDHLLDVEKIGVSNRTIVDKKEGTVSSLYIRGPKFYED